MAIMTAPPATANPISAPLARYAGVDTHKDTHHVAVVDELGRSVVDRQFLTTGAGCRQIVGFLHSHGPIQAIGVEGTGSYGAALARNQAANVAVAGEDPGVATSLAKKMAIEAHRVDPKLHCVLAEQIPRTGRLENVDSANRAAHAAFRTYLESCKDELGVADVGLAAFVCSTSIEAVAHNAVLHHADLSKDAAVEPLIEDTTRLIVGYLKRV